MRCPLWRALRKRAEAWRQFGAPAHVCRVIHFGVYEWQTLPLVPAKGLELGDIIQTKEDEEFAMKDLEDGYASGIYQKNTTRHAQCCKSKGAVISSSFTTWQGHGDDRNGRFIINLSRQTKHWRKGYLKMESPTEFASTMKQGDHFISFDVYKGYRILNLHPSVRDYFIFRYKKKYYQCLSLPFGWSLSPWWFTQVMIPFLREIRSYGYRALDYIDDFLLATSPMGKRPQRQIEWLKSAG